MRDGDDVYKRTMVNIVARANSKSMTRINKVRLTPLNLCYRCRVTQGGGSSTVSQTAQSPFSSNRLVVNVLMIGTVRNRS